MFFDKRDQERDRTLDRMGKTVIRAAGLSESESDAVAESPFLYARVRARIEAEKRQDRQSVPVLAMLYAWRALAAVAIVAIVAVSTFWVKTPAAPQATTVREDNVNLVATGGTCALSNSAECAISTEEVLATLFAEEGKSER
jgi:flagellar biosynthesis/type III secretory pathway M-ring protein FliF/YscJ